ncbi:cytochrome P450 [Actinosynnema sp. NPDC059797]
MRPASTTTPLLPGAIPVAGHLVPFLRDPLAFVRGLRDHGPLVRLRLGPRTVWVVTTPELARRVYVTDQNLFDKGGPLFDKVRLYLGNGLVTCSGAEHPRQRALVQPAFHRDRLRAYTDIAANAVTEITGTWRPGQVVRLDTEVHRFAATVTARSLITAPAGLRAAAEAARVTMEIFNGLFWQMIMPGEAFAKLPLPVNRRYRHRVARVRALVDEVIDLYRDGPDHGDLLSTLVRAHDDTPDGRRQIHDQVITFITAGVETAAHGMVWTLRLLDAHPDVADRVRAELRDTLGDRPPGHDDLASLPCTRAAATEALRLRPPGWLITRTAPHDVHWDDLHIPAGADVLVSPYALHHDPTAFPDPDRFDPDRWLPPRLTSAQREAYFAFGAGRRKCIGDTMGLDATTVLLAELVGRRRLHHLSDTTHDRGRPRLNLIPPPTPVRVD